MCHSSPDSFRLVMNNLCHQSLPQSLRPCAILITLALSSSQFVTPSFLSASLSYDIVIAGSLSEDSCSTNSHPHAGVWYCSKLHIQVHKKIMPSVSQVIFFSIIACRHGGCPGCSSGQAGADLVQTCQQRTHRGLQGQGSLSQGEQSSIDPNWKPYF